MSSLAKLKFYYTHTKYFEWRVEKLTLQFLSYKYNFHEKYDRLLYVVYNIPVEHVLHWNQNDKNGY